MCSYCYSDALDRWYFLPAGPVANRTAISLRLTPPRNGQRGCINLASDYEFYGAVAQLEERLHGMQEAGGSSPPSSTPASPSVLSVRAHQFRNHFGYYLERAAAGDEVHVSRRASRMLVCFRPLDFSARVAYVVAGFAEVERLEGDQGCADRGGQCEGN
jgi:hypothetical protein